MVPATGGSRKVIVDSWYAEVLGTPDVVLSVDAAILQRFPGGIFSPGSKLTRQFRGILWFVAARNAESVVCTLSARGVTLFLVLCALTPRRTKRIYLVEFFRTRRTGFKARAIDVVFRALYRLLLRRTLTRAQVATEWEADSYAREFGLPRSRFCYVPMPIVRFPGVLPEAPEVASGTVLASGRSACDWPTLFAAARGATWPLTVVCSAEDLEQVHRLNRDGRAVVLSEISPDEHHRLLSDATVYALVLCEQYGSSGHVRMSRAIEAGVPVVASSVMALQGYLEPDVTGISVPPGDSSALRAAIDGLIDSPELRKDLRARAYAVGCGRSIEDYLIQIRRMVFEDGQGPEPNERMEASKCES